MIERKVHGEERATGNGNGVSTAVAATLASPEYRIEGHLKVTGRARYTADVRLPGMLWARFLTSPHPHARIVSIDTAAARAMPGVHAVLTGEDVRGARFGRVLLDWPVLAWDRVRFIGERVAAVAAETREIADRALAAIRVEYEELSAVFESEEALREGAPILHEHPEEYRMLVGTRLPVPHPNLQGHQVVRKHDEELEAAFARAHRVFEHTFTTPRQHQGYIEPHAAVVWIEEDSSVRVVSTNKSPFLLRGQMAAVHDLPPEKIVVDSGFIGGDFGGKGLSIDEFVCYYLARASGRPVKAVMTYVDELQASNPRHASTIRLRTGVDEQGRFVAHEAEIVFNGGAYAAGKPIPTLIPGAVTVHGGLSTLPAYHVPHVRMELKSVYTNTVPGGHMRAPGEVQTQFASESHVDIIARELGIDPLEFRLRNAVQPGQTGPGNERFREPRAVEVLTSLREATRWGAEPLPPNVGRGVSLGVREIHGGRTGVTLRLRADGKIEILTGLPDQGVGSHTLFRRIAAAVLGVDQERIVVTRGTTAEAPFDLGAGASRVTWVVGRAVDAGAQHLRERLQELAAEVLGWTAGLVRLEQDRFVHDAAPVEVAAFEEVAARLAQGAPVEAQGTYESAAHSAEEPSDYNFVAYMVEVEVDPDTGQVQPRDVVMAIDVGTIINPLGHQGQLDGGFAQGLGTALMEDLAVEDGKVTTLSLGEYKLPTEMDMPPFRTVHVPTLVGPGPWGAKMAGEANSSGVAPAVANAVADAVGVRLTRLPITGERVLAALRERGQ